MTFLEYSLNRAVLGPDFDKVTAVQAAIVGLCSFHVAGSPEQLRQLRLAHFVGDDLSHVIGPCEVTGEETCS
jgi:hypothetical protein